MDVHAPASNNNNNNNYNSSNINNNNINKKKKIIIIIIAGLFFSLHYIFNVLYFAYALTLICLFCVTYVLYNNKKILIVKKL